MRGLDRLLAVLAVVAMTAVLAPAMAQAQAHEFTAGPIRISQAWTRVPPEASRVAGGFMTITNTGSEPDTLLGGSATIAGAFEVHEMAMDGGVMRMRELKPGLVIKPGETVVLRPGSFHIMFMDLKQAPIAGQPIKGTLVFAKAGTVAIEYKVEPFGARGPGGEGAGPGSHDGTGQSGGGHAKQ